MDVQRNRPQDSRYLLSTIGGIFGRADHDRFLLETDVGQFDDLFPSSLHGMQRCLYESGVDALAAVLAERAEGRDVIRLWTAENFCQESLERLSKKLPHRLEFAAYRSPDDLRNIRPKDFVLFLHFNRYDPASVEVIEKLKQTGVTTIEDFVHAPLDILQFTGDTAINSLRKFTSVDVAVTYQRGPLQGTVAETAYHRLRKEAERVRSDFLKSPSDELEQRFLELTRNSDGALSVPQVCPAHPSEIQRARTFDFQTAQQLRRANYVHLAWQLKTQWPQAKILPGEYMYLMLDISQRDRFRQELFSQRIFPVIHWADSGSQLSRSLLSLHIDQRYTPADMDRVLAAIGRIDHDSGQI